MNTKSHFLELASQTTKAYHTMYSKRVSVTHMQSISKETLQFHEVYVSDFAHLGAGIKCSGKNQVDVDSNPG